MDLAPGVKEGPEKKSGNKIWLVEPNKKWYFFYNFKCEQTLKSKCGLESFVTGFESCSVTYLVW